jgi:hypothetical protein
VLCSDHGDALVLVRTKRTLCRNVSHVEEAAEVLLNECPKSAMRDPICLAARKACYDALRGVGEVENARTEFAATAREVGILGM